MPQQQQINPKKVLSDVQNIIKKEQSSEEKLLQICRYLADEFEVFDWVGFYLVDPEKPRELVLGPYVGEPTDHTRIPFGKGICGQAADTLETFVVQDVSEADNYLACSLEVQAEIVVPIMYEGTLLGELDIDSHQRNSITQAHENLLTEICTLVAPLIA